MIQNFMNTVIHKNLYRDIKWLFDFAKLTHLSIHFHNSNACLLKIYMDLVVIH